MDYSSEYILQKSSLGRENKIIGSSESHLAILDDEFEELLAAGKLIRIRYWYNKLGKRVKTHRDHYTTWITFDEVFSPLQWAHLPRNHIIGENTRHAWFCCPSCVLVEISSG